MKIKCLLLKVINSLIFSLNPMKGIELSAGSM